MAVQALKGGKNSRAAVVKRLEATFPAKHPPVDGCVPAAADSQDIAGAHNNLQAAAETALAADACYMFAVAIPAGKGAALVHQSSGRTHIQTDAAGDAGRLRQADIHIRCEHGKGASLAQIQRVVGDQITAGADAPAAENTAVMIQ